MQANGKFDRGDKEVISLLCGIGIFFLIFLYVAYCYM